jgi:peptidylprolyl isomerase
LKKLVVLILGLTLLATILFVSGCSSGSSADSTPVKDGDTVGVEYTGTLADGTQFDSNVGKDALAFTVGKGQMIAGFDKAVVGMKIGDVKTVTIPAAEAYGAYDNNKLIDVSRDKLPVTINPKVGDKLPMQSGGQTIYLPIVKVTATTVTVDANSPLAGKDLTFKIKLLTIVK